jgi:ABC-type nitrate/sulfonate/bicarbonate transport system substrate-binding protein
MEKKHAGTLLISPFEVEAEAKGYNRLANGSEALGAYQGLVGATRRDWAKANEAQVIGYIRGYVAALDWLYMPPNKAEAIAILRKYAPNMAEQMATRSYDVLLDARSGFERKAVLNEAGVRTVLAHMGFPKEHWPQLHSTNPLERLNGEINRRTDVVAIFPNGEAG